MDSKNGKKVDDKFFERCLNRPFCRELFILTLLFFASRAIFMFAGIRFDISPLYYFSQFLDIDLLQTDLFRSLWHLHMQPPLFNLFLGLVIKVFPSFFSGVFPLVYLLCGLVITLSLSRIFSYLGLARFWRIYLPLLFSISPSVILNENWLFYTYPVMALFTIALLVLARNGRLNLYMFFGVLTAIALTRSLFHLIFVLGIALLFALKMDIKKLILPVLIALMVITGFYGKNLVQFGFFGGSSWLGLSLGKMTVIPPEKLDKYIADGEMSTFAAVPPYSSLERYGVDTMIKTGVPALDRITHENKPNFNNPLYIEISNTLKKDSFKSIKLHPQIYLKKVMQAFYIFHLPSSDNPFLQENRQKIHVYNQLWNRVVFGQFFSGAKFSEPRDEKIGNLWELVKLTRFFLLFAVFVTIVLSLHALVKSKNPLLLFSAFSFLYVVFFGSLLEVGENYRFCFLVSPAMFTILIFYASKIPILRRIFF